MDYLDFLMHDRENEYLNGVYFKDESSEPQYFEYGIVIESQKEYSSIVDRLYADNRSLTIKTTWDLDYEINGFVVTQDGARWQISAVANNISERNKQVSRLLRSNPSQSFEITLIGTAKPDEPETY